jgi:hypothetical protein
MWYSNKFTFRNGDGKLKVTISILNDLYRVDDIVKEEFFSLGNATDIRS